jgi:hypothetical protein
MDDAEARLAQMSEEWTVILASSSGDREVIGSWEQSIDSPAETIGRVMAVYGDQGARRRQGGRRIRDGQKSPAGGCGRASVVQVQRQRLGLVELPSA